MPDPVTSMDVEDVLSSIRRLVSEESKSDQTRAETKAAARNPQPKTDIHEEAEVAVERAVTKVLGEPARKAETAPLPEMDPPSNEINEAAPEPGPALRERLRRFSVTGPAAAEGGDQKLVLTAALRVPDEDTAEQAADANEGDDDQAPARPVAGPTFGSRRSDKSHLRPLPKTEAEAPEAGFHAEEDDIDEGDGFGSGGATGSGGSSGSGSMRAKSFDFAPEDQLFERASRAMEEVRNARPERASLRLAPEPDAEAARAFDAADYGSGGRPASGDYEEEYLPETDTEDRFEDEAEDTAPKTFAEASPFSPFGAAFRTRELTPDDTENAAGADAPDEDEDSTVNFTDDEDSILDEDTLRDLVSQMVREELQGELGDRITRNVRKLVRREIARALASREFE